jgi:hypothetical protein
MLAEQYARFASGNKKGPQDGGRPEAEDYLTYLPRPNAIRGRGSGLTRSRVDRSWFWKRPASVNRQAFGFVRDQMADP